MEWHGPVPEGPQHDGRGPEGHEACGHNDGSLQGASGGDAAGDAFEREIHHHPGGEPVAGVADFVFGLGDGLPQFQKLELEIDEEGSTQGRGGGEEQKRGDGDAHEGKLCFAFADEEIGVFYAQKGDADEGEIGEKDEPSGLAGANKCVDARDGVGFWGLLRALPFGGEAEGEGAFGGHGLKIGCLGMCPPTVAGLVGGARGLRGAACCVQSGWWDKSHPTREGGAARRGVQVSLCQMRGLWLASLQARL